MNIPKIYVLLEMGLVMRLIEEGADLGRDWGQGSGRELAIVKVVLKIEYQV